MASNSSMSYKRTLYLLLRETLAVEEMLVLTITQTGVRTHAVRGPPSSLPDSERIMGLGVKSNDSLKNTSPTRLGRTSNVSSTSTSCLSFLRSIRESQDPKHSWGLCIYIFPVSHLCFQPVCPLEVIVFINALPAL